jgi:hypothetical protein
MHIRKVVLITGHRQMSNSLQTIIPADQLYICYWLIARTNVERYHITEQIHKADKP